jgi:hypothetical protein
MYRDATIFWILISHFSLLKTFQKTLKFSIFGKILPMERKVAHFKLYNITTQMPII